MQMDRFIRENGYQAKNRVREYSSKQIIHPIQENGQMMPNMVMGNRNGQTEHNTRAIFIMVKKRGMEY